MDNNYSIRLPIFEGPLDLLLHLIKKHEVDVYDIPIALIAEQYLEYIDLMTNLDLDLAGEFLVMASTLAQIKSRMLLPPKEGEPGVEDGVDPRAELVLRLIEYKKFKEAAEGLGERESLWREVFMRDTTGAWEDREEPVQEELFNFGLFDLLEAFRRVIVNLPEGSAHIIGGDQISIADKINEILEKLEGGEAVRFESLFEDDKTRSQVVASFMAILELVKLRTIKIFQSESFGPIRIMKAVTEDGPEQA
jgi:segregation and condensation protein A